MTLENTLSENIINKLNTSGYLSMEDLASLSDSQIRRIKGLQNYEIKQIKTQVALFIAEKFRVR